MTAPLTEKRSLLYAFRAPWPYVLGALVFALVVAFFPQIDLAVSSAVYDPARGGFYFSQYWWMDVLDVITSLASSVMVLGVVAWWLVMPRLRPHAPRIRERMVAYLLIAFLIGPVLIISLGFKEHWGRNRPVEVTQFAGAEAFTPYYLPYGVCEDDCSFPSGHSSRGFFFVALAIAAYGFGWPQRRLILASAIGFGTLAAGLRILEGKHFLSDVTFSAIIVTYVSWVVFRLVFRHTDSPLVR